MQLQRILNSDKTHIFTAGISAKSKKVAENSEFRVSVWFPSLSMKVGPSFTGCAVAADHLEVVEQLRPEMNGR